MWHVVDAKMQKKYLENIKGLWTEFFVIDSCIFFNSPCNQSRDHDGEEKNNVQESNDENPRREE